MYKKYVDSSFEGTIRPLTNSEEDCDKLADLFNTFDPVWPGGFTHGKPYDRKRSKEFIERQSAIEILIAEKPDGKFGSYCSLYERKYEVGTSYVALLGADPNLHGKKYGKNILIKAMEIAMDNGYKRVDLNTWASNLKAVPLYKKTGYFWVPDTSVYMQNYIPTILNESFFNDFFELCNYNWYDTQIRETAQKHDDIKENDNAVFPYEFKYKDNYIKAIFDKYSRELTGVESSINGETIKIRGYTNQHEISMGDESLYTIEVTNGTKQDRAINLLIEGFTGIVFTGNTSIKTLIKTGENKKLTVPYYIDSKTSTEYKRNRPSPAIKANIIIDDKLLILRTGMEIQKALSINTASIGGVKLKPGSEKTLILKMLNKNKKAIKGKLIILTPDNIEYTMEDKYNTVIELKKDEYKGIPVKIKVPENYDKNSRIALKVLTEYSFENSDKKITSKIETLNIPVITNGIISYLWKENHIVIQNEKVLLSINLEGGDAEFIRLNEDNNIFNTSLFLSTRLGPPFGISEFLTKMFDYEIIDNQDNIKVIISCLSEDNQGLIIKQEFIIDKNSEVLKTRVGLTNILTDKSYELGIRFGINKEMLDDLNELYIPIKGCIIKSNEHGVPGHLFDFPNESENFSENWIINASSDKYIAMYWENGTPYKITPGNPISILQIIEHKLPEVKTGETVWSSYQWINIGNGSWEYARNYYYSNIIKTEEKKDLPILPLLEFKLDSKNIPIIMNNKQSFKMKIEGYHRRNTPLMGNIEIQLPDKWKEKNNESLIFNIENFQVDNDFSKEIEVIPSEDLSEGFTMSYGKIIFHERTGTKEFSLAIPLIIEEKVNNVDINETEEEGKKVFIISNGMLKISTSPDFGCTIHKLETSDGINHIKSTFPEISQNITYQEWLGSIRIINISMEGIFNEQKEHRNKYEFKEYRDGDWVGIEYRTIEKEQKSLYGVVKIIRYTMKKGLPLIKITRAFNNSTGFEHDIFNIINICPMLENKMENNIVNFNQGGKCYNYNRELKQVLTFNRNSKESTVLMTHKNTKRGMALINPDKNASTLVVDLGEMMYEIYGGNLIRLKGDSKENENTYTSYILLGNFQNNDIDYLREIFSQIS